MTPAVGQTAIRPRLQALRPAAGLHHPVVVTPGEALSPGLCSADDGAFAGPCHRIGPGTIAGKRCGYFSDQRDGAAVDEQQLFADLVAAARPRRTAERRFIAGSDEDLLVAIIDEVIGVGNEVSAVDGNVSGSQGDVCSSRADQRP